MTHRASKIFLFILTGVTILILTILLNQNFKQHDNTYFIVTPITKADIGIQGLFFAQTRMGEIEWAINAKSAEIFESEHLAAFTGVHVLLRTPQGLEISFDGDKGMINTDSHDFKIEKEKDEIKVQMNNGYTALTRALVWRDQEREISSDQPVRIFGPGLVINGVGMLIRTLSQEFTITQDVHVILQQ